MKIKKTTIKPFSAAVTFGLERGYTKQKIDKLKVINFLQNYQNQLISEKNIYLSISVSNCDIVLSDQMEPHMKLNFINYPKFQLDVKEIKFEIETLVKSIIKEFNQNRIIIEYLDETVMLESSNKIDPRIK